MNSEKKVNKFNHSKMKIIQAVFIESSGKIQIVNLSFPPNGSHQICPSVGRYEFYLEPDGNEWRVIFINKDSGNILQTSQLKNLQFIKFSGKLLNEVYYWFSNFITPDSKFINYYPSKDQIEVVVGRNSDCDIVVNNPAISGTHCLLSFHNRKWTIKDLKSQNGTFVNKQRVTNQSLSVGDSIFIYGLQIIIGKGYLSLQSPEQIHINNQKLLLLVSKYSKDKSKGTNLSDQETWFYPTPRKLNSFTPMNINFDAPPPPMTGNKIPLLLRHGGGLLSGGTAAASGNFIMLGMLLFPMLTSKYSEKQIEEYEARRQALYSQYLEEKKLEVLKEKIREENYLKKVYPPTNQFLEEIKEERTLWNHSQSDPDFLNIRIGSGPQPLLAEIKYPSEKFSLEKDKLVENMLFLAQQKVYLENTPTLISLNLLKNIGIIGDKTSKYNLFLIILIHIISKYNYNEVKVILLVDEKDANQFVEFRYIPHIWDDNNETRYFAQKVKEAEKLDTLIQSTFNNDSNNSEENPEISKNPHYIVFCFDQILLDAMPFLKTKIHRKNTKLSILSFGEILPKEARTLIEFNSNKRGVVIDLNGQDSDRPFILDDIDYSRIGSILSLIRRMRIKPTELQKNSLPESLTFLDMYRAANLEQLNVLERWNQGDSVLSLSAPIGIGTDGSQFFLDLHQKKHGPHGLIAGMTGSGKSEFVLTYVLSMACSFSPEEVAFVLIDYKGGGLVDAFDNESKGIHLPHVIGSITNLDGSTIQRSLSAIESELTRRQELFHEVTKIADGGVMDIYSYQRLYREGKVKEALPHLFIISDEFAELKEQQPKFMDSLVSIARIGRSLGVHLILATQKPSVAVTSEIRANSSFKVCLKVQDPGDSNEMINRSDAAYLKETGRFYLKVGTDEYFGLAQSGWSGADYIPKQKYEKIDISTIELVNSIGQTIGISKEKIFSGKKSSPQITQVINHITQISQLLGFCPKQLWMDPLPENIVLESLWEKYTSTLDHLIIGMMDDPTNQSQFPMAIDLINTKNFCIIGNSGYGKSVFLYSLILTLVNSVNPEEYSFYILDYSTRMMKCFSDLPNCGGVLYEEDSSQISGFFDLLEKIELERKSVLADLGVDNFKSARTIKMIPLILVIIDGVSIFSEIPTAKNIYYQLDKYLKKGPNLGIIYILAEANLSTLSFRIPQNIEKTIAFNLNKAWDYQSALNTKNEIIPAKIPGRCLIAYGENGLEGQVGLFSPFTTSQERFKIIKEFIKSHLLKYQNINPALRLPVLDFNADYETFSSQFALKRIPIGFSLQSNLPIALPLFQMDGLTIFVGDTSKKNIFIENILSATSREQMELIIFKKSDKSYFKDSFIKMNQDRFPQIKLFNLDDNLADSMTYFRNLVKPRREKFLDICEEREIDPERPLSLDIFNELFELSNPILILIESLEDFSKLEDVRQEIFFSNLLKNAHKRNIFPIAFMGPEFEKENMKNSLIFDTFNPHENYLILSDPNQKQYLVSQEKIMEYLKGIKGNKLQNDFRFGFMYYRKELYPIYIPTRLIELERFKLDEANIFN